MARNKRGYNNNHRQRRDRVRTVADLAAFATNAGMPATLIAQGFRVEIRNGQPVMVTEQRYMLR